MDNLAGDYKRPVQITAEGLALLMSSAEAYGGIGGGTYRNEDKTPRCYIGHLVFMLDEVDPVDPRRHLLATNWLHAALDKHQGNIYESLKFMDDHAPQTAQINDRVVSSVNKDLGKGYHSQRITFDQWWAKLNELFNVKVVE